MGNSLIKSQITFDNYNSYKVKLHKLTLKDYRFLEIDYVAITISILKLKLKLICINLPRFEFNLN